MKGSETEVTEVNKRIRGSKWSICACRTEGGKCFGGDGTFRANQKQGKGLGLSFSSLRKQTRQDTYTCSKGNKCYCLWKWQILIWEYFLFLLHSAWLVSSLPLNEFNVNDDRYYVTITAPFCAFFHTVLNKWKSKPDNIIGVPPKRLSEVVASIIFILIFRPIKYVFLQKYISTSWKSSFKRHNIYLWKHQNIDHR